MIHILVTVRGGVVQAVSSTEEIRMKVLDYDNIDAGERTDSEFECQDYIQTSDEMLAMIEDVNSNLTDDEMDGYEDDDNLDDE